MILRLLRFTTFAFDLTAKKGNGLVLNYTALAVMRMV